MMPPEIHAFQATTESFGSWKTQGETKSQIPRSRFVQSCQRLARPLPLVTLYDVMTTSYFDRSRPNFACPRNMGLPVAGSVHADPSSSGDLHFLGGSITNSP